MIRWNEDVLKRVASEVVAPVASRVLDAARSRVPVDTGELRDTLALVEQDDGTILVVAGTDHARWVHDGTVDTEAVPFLTDAAQAAS